MNLHLAPLSSAAIGLALLAAAAGAPAGSPTTYERDRAACLSGQTNQERSTCLREADAARAEAARGTPPTEETALQANRLKRCAPLPDPDRRDCEARMQGAGTTSGSAEAGGIYRELVTREPAAPPAAVTPAK